MVSRFAFIVLLLGLMVTLFITWLIASREFVAARAEAIRLADTAQIDRLLLPAAIQDRSSEQLNRFLDHNLNETIVHAVLYDGVGDVLASRQWHEAGEIMVPSLVWQRKGANPLQRTVRERSATTDGTRKSGFFEGLWESYLSARVSDVTIPIVSPINPLAVDSFTEAELLDGWSALDDVNSSYVVAYLTLAVSHQSLWWQLRYQIATTLLYCLSTVALTTALALYLGRRLLSPFLYLAQEAQRAASGSIDTNIRFKAGGEAGHIAGLLNATFSELRRYRTAVGIDRELLSLKVEAQGSMLTERDQQLDEARTEVSKTRDDLHRMAYYDSLTGLPNRRLFTEQLNMLLQLCLREDKLLGLMFIDLDNFKRINDSLGHAAGDLLLREVSIRLANCTRTSDLLGHFVQTHIRVEVSRLGGDEFTIVMNNLHNPEEASLVAERVLKSLSTPMNIDGHEIFVTPSVGIAIGPRDGQDVDSLVRAADTAMYEAKAAGKNNYVFYSDTMDTSNIRRLQFEADLRKAIEREELLLHYQPMVSIETGSVVGLEALLRWKHPELGMVNPGEFIALAEELGLILEFGEWTLSEVCRTVNRLQSEDYDLPRVNINVSTIAVSRSFVERVRTIISSSEVDPSKIELELTESVLMEADASSIESLHALKQLGVSLSIDDFGTGYSSLSYLSHFPLDALKIDRSFVQDFDKGTNNRKLVEAIASLAKSLDLRVTAEGVETPEQLNMLRELDVDVIQGYLFSKPVDVARVPFILQEGHFSAQVSKAGYVPPPDLVLEKA